MLAGARPHSLLTTFYICCADSAEEREEEQAEEQEEEQEQEQADGKHAIYHVSRVFGTLFS